MGFCNTIVKYALCTECPLNFTYIASVDGCYKVVSRKQDWTFAGLECRSLHRDAHLIVINDAQEQSAVAEMLAATDRQLNTLSFGLNVFLFRRRLQIDNNRIKIEKKLHAINVKLQTKTGAV